MLLYGNVDLLTSQIKWQAVAAIRRLSDSVRDLKLVKQMMMLLTILIATIRYAKLRPML